MTKTPLLLVPGLLCSPRLYAPQVAALGQDRPLGARPGAGREIPLAGLSLGGMIAVEIMQIAADRM